MDYHEVNWKFEEKYELPPGVYVTDEEMKRVQKLRLGMKNAVMHQILQLRKRPKFKNMTAVLEKMSEAAAKIKQDREQEEKDMQGQGLLQRLQTQEVSKNRI